MKVYLPNYDNGEPYGDNFHYVSDTIYYREEDAVQEILDEGYTYNGNTIEYLSTVDGEVTPRYDMAVDEEDFYTGYHNAHAYVSVLTLK